MAGSSSRSTALNIAANSGAFIFLCGTILFVLACVIAICNWYYRKLYQEIRKSYDSNMNNMFEREGFYYPHTKRARESIMDMGDDPLQHLEDHDGGGDGKSKVISQLLFTKINATEVHSHGGGGGGGFDDLEANCQTEGNLEVVYCSMCSKKVDDDTNENSTWVVVAGCLHICHRVCESQRERCCWRSDQTNHKITLMEVSITVKPLVPRA